MSLDKKPFYDTFMPGNVQRNLEEMEETHKFRRLNEVSKLYSNFDEQIPSQMHSGKHVGYFQSLQSETVVKAKMLTDQNPNLEFSPDVNALLSMVLTDEIDKELKAYLGSNYAVMSFGYRELTAQSREDNPSIKWHCDVAPINSAMVICYLNDDNDHDSSTLFLSEKTTKELKKLGYIYSFVKDRHENIDEMLDYYQLDSTVERHDFKAGESVIFCAPQVAHRAEVPREGTVRATLDIAVIPSPVPWQEALRRGFTPGNAYAAYQGQVSRLLKALNIGELPKVIENIIYVDSNGSINSENSLRFHLNVIFGEGEFSNSLFYQLQEIGVNYESLTITELTIFLKKQFNSGLNWDRKFTKDDLININRLLGFESDHVGSLDVFVMANKPDPTAMMWPIPNHETHPNSKYAMSPFVVKPKIMTKNTPIGSAGSCFAVEIAEVLQKEEFNYVVTELGDNPLEEAIIDGYEVDSGKAMYSANFGILFNTPSLLQLAQKAFSEKVFTKYLAKAPNGLYMDPYRENVYFRSEENYLRDYPKHVEAIKQVLLQSEVFIFTAGLNECWQMFDGTVISRNPREGFYHLIQHKVLTVQENIDNILSFFNLVKRHNPKFKLVLTLSPVPLLATGRAETHHILEANTHSKAVLRVALEEVVKQHEDIYYLPSYELVTECTENPWEPDHRHVTRDTVSRVVSMFKEMFVSE